MYSRLSLVFVAALPLLVASHRPTHCERWKGDTEFRCGKDGYMADKIHIHSISNTRISFKVSKWMSACGGTNVNFWNHDFSLESGHNADVEFDAAPSGMCYELYVFGCKQNDATIDCLQIVSVYPLDVTNTKTDRNVTTLNKLPYYHINIVNSTVYNYFKSEDDINKDN